MSAEPLHDAPARSVSRRCAAAPASGWRIAISLAETAPAGAPLPCADRSATPALRRRLEEVRVPAELPPPLVNGDLFLLLVGDPRCAPETAVEPGAAGERERLDAVALLGAYRCRGAAALDALRGRFACVLVDARRGLAAAVRDPLGHHPLFWARSGDTLLLSDRIEELLVAPGVSRDLDVAALAGYLCERWPAEGETYNRAVRRVRPGFVLEASPRGVEERRYWGLHRPGGDVDWLAEEATRRFPLLFEAAVGRAAGRRSSAIALSSGLDSASVAVAAARRARRGAAPLPRAWGLAFSEADCDERREQRRVAAAVGLDLELLPVRLAAPGGRGPLHELVELAPHLPAPPVNPLLPSFLRLHRTAAARGCRVVLTGNGGDEWMGVSPFLAADLLRRGAWRQLWELGRSLQRSVRLPAWRVWWNHGWKFGLRPLAVAAAASLAGPRWNVVSRFRTRRRLPGWMAPDPRLRAELVERWTPPPPAYRPQSFYWRDVERGLDHALVSMAREESFEAGRRSGVSIRAPFEDDRTVETVVRIPPRLLMQGGRSKGLVRDYLAAELPGVGLQHQRKVGFTGFFHATVFREGIACMRHLGGFPALEAAGVARSADLARDVEAIVTGRDRGAAATAWSALVLESWLRREVRR